MNERYLVTEGLSEGCCTPLKPEMCQLVSENFKHHFCNLLKFRDFPLCLGLSNIPQCSLTVSLVPGITYLFYYVIGR